MQKPDMKKLGKKGGVATRKKYGSTHFASLAKKRWEKTKKTATETV